MSLNSKNWNTKSGMYYWKPEFRRAVKFQCQHLEVHSTSLTISSAFKVLTPNKFFWLSPKQVKTTHALEVFPAYLLGRLKL